MVHVVVARGVTASTKPQMERVMEMPLNLWDSPQPNRRNERVNPPTFVPGGMLIEDRTGRVQAVWTPETEHRMSGSRKLIGFLLITLAVCVLSVTDITVPAVWPVGATAATGYLGWLMTRQHRATAVRQAQNRPQRPVREPQAYNRRRTLYGDTSLRIGDAERDQVIAELGIHFSAGRLDADEYDERSTRAVQAKRYVDLDECLTDLPALNTEERKRM